MCCSARVGKAAELPKWIKPQLTRNVEEAPAGDDWLHEIKYDGYRMHARLDCGKIQLLTRTGLDWSKRYRRIVEVIQSLPVRTAYLDGELYRGNLHTAALVHRGQPLGEPAHCPVQGTLRDQLLQ